MGSRSKKELHQTYCQKDLGQLQTTLSNISHDIKNNPLTDQMIEKHIQIQKSFEDKINKTLSDLLLYIKQNPIKPPLRVSNKVGEKTAAENILDLLADLMSLNGVEIVSNTKLFSSDTDKLKVYGAGDLASGDRHIVIMDSGDKVKSHSTGYTFKLPMLEHIRERLHDFTDAHKNLQTTWERDKTLKSTISTQAHLTKDELLKRYENHEKDMQQRAEEHLKLITEQNQLRQVPQLSAT